MQKTIKNDSKSIKQQLNSRIENSIESIQNELRQACRFEPQWISGHVNIEEETSFEFVVLDTL